MTTRFVEDPVKDWRQMDGGTPVVQRLNSFLTVHFISGQDVPSDECLADAQHLVNLWASSSNFENDCGNYLIEQFATLRKYKSDECFEAVVDEKLAESVIRAISLVIDILLRSG